MNRKIIQICASQAQEEYKITTVLCDDGTLWEGYQRYENISPTKRYLKFVWEQLPDIPQDTSNLTRVR